jgi:hypothetical protein
MIPTDSMIQFEHVLIIKNDIKPKSTEGYSEVKNESKMARFHI